MEKKCFYLSFIFAAFFILSSNAHAYDWNGPVLASQVPGTGLIQSASNFVLPDDSALMQGFWRGNQGFWRTVPLVNGEPDWNNPGDWSSPISIDTLPGCGLIQSQSNFILPDDSALMQGFWRGNQGFWRTVPIIDNQLRWELANDWSSPMEIDELPGSGDMQAQMELVNRSLGYIRQTIARGGKLHWRFVPIVNNIVDWNAASGWMSATPYAYQFPGSGDILALDMYVLPNGIIGQWSLWRGNSDSSQEGYYSNFILCVPGGHQPCVG